MATYTKKAKNYSTLLFENLLRLSTSKARKKKSQKKKKNLILLALDVETIIFTYHINIRFVEYPISVLWFHSFCQMCIFLFHSAPIKCFQLLILQSHFLIHKQMFNVQTHVMKLKSALWDWMSSRIRKFIKSICKSTKDFFREKDKYTKLLNNFPKPMRKHMHVLNFGEI